MLFLARLSNLPSVPLEQQAAAVQERVAEKAGQRREVAQQKEQHLQQRLTAQRVLDQQLEPTAAQVPPPSTVSMLYSLFLPSLLPAPPLPGRAHDACHLLFSFAHASLHAVAAGGFRGQEQV